MKPDPTLPRLASASDDARASHSPPAAPLTLRKIIWPVLLSLAALGVIGYLTFDPASFREVLQQLNPWFLAAAVGTVVVRVYLGAWRLSYVSNGRLSFSQGTRGQLAWDFFSNVTPSAIGGGPFAALYIARDSNIRVGEATALMLFTMLLDQLWFACTIPIVLAATFYVEVIPASLGSFGVAAVTLYFAGILAWVVLFGYATVFRPDLLQRFASRLFRFRWLRRYRERVEREMLQLRRRAQILRSQPLRFYVHGLLLTVGTWVSRFLLLLFIVWSVSDDFDALLLMLRTAAMTLGTLVLPTPGGSGGVEGLYALFIGPLIPQATLAPTLLVWRVLGYYLFVALGIFLSTHHVQQRIRRRREAPAGPHAPAYDPPYETPEEEGVLERND